MSVHRSKRRQKMANLGKEELAALREELEHLSQRADSLSKSAKKNMKKTHKQIKRRSAQAMKNAKHAQDTTEKCIKERPLASVGGALAVGVLVGLALKKR